MTKEQWLKIARGAGIAVAGALLTYASSVMIPAMQESGNAVLLAVAAFASVAVNVVRKYLEGRADVE